MNPTARNISSQKEWTALRAPWIGTKTVWNLFSKIGRFSETLLNEIIRKKAIDWNTDFADKVYQEIAKNSLYITNLSKAIQLDARPLSNKVFKQYLLLFCKEIKVINSRLIILFGNQVSSIILERSVKRNEIHSKIFNKFGFNMVVTYYPVGQDRRNMPIAIGDIRNFMGECL